MCKLPKNQYFISIFSKKREGGTSPNPPDPFFLSEIRLSRILVPLKLVVLKLVPVILMVLKLVPVILMVLILVPVILVVLILVPRLLKISITNFSGTNFSTRKKKLTKI